MEGETLVDVLPRIRETYCGTIAYEIEHISDHQERVWLRQAIESGRYRSPLTEDEKKRMLARLTEVEGFEHYLRRAFLGQKQFSIEGLDVMVPMLDESLSLAAEAGAHEVVIGMAHRGRLNVLAHIIGRPYEELLREFEGERTIEAVTAKAEAASGDVNTTWARSDAARRAPGSSRSPWQPIRATSRPSIPSSKGSRARSRPTGLPGRHRTIRVSPCLCSSTATRPSRARESSPRR